MNNKVYFVEFMVKGEPYRVRVEAPTQKRAKELVKNTFTDSTKLVAYKA